MKYAEKIGDLARYYRLFEILRTRFDLGAKILKCIMQLTMLPECEKVIVERTGTNPFKFLNLTLNNWWKEEIRKQSLALRKLILLLRVIIDEQLKPINLAASPCEIKKSKVEHLMDDLQEAE